MKHLLALFALLLGSTLLSSQTVDLNNTNNGACNAPCSTLTRYFTSLAPGELILVEAGWAGQKLTATVSDGVNTYRRLSGPANVGPVLRTQVWYALNAGSPQGVTVTVNGPTQPGWFDGILIQSVVLSGVNRKNPVDLQSIASATGTGKTFSVTSGTLQSSHEMLFGLFIEGAAGAPYHVPAGWREIGGGEAVTLTEFAYVAGGKPQTITGTAGIDVAWAGVAIGVNPAP